MDDIFGGGALETLRNIREHGIPPKLPRLAVAKPQPFSLLAERIPKNDLLILVDAETEYNGVHAPF